MVQEGASERLGVIDRSSKKERMEESVKQKREYERVGEGEKKDRDLEKSKSEKEGDGAGRDER
eukprot:1374069-Amorphochlora_amoeboformis.AAC.1